MNPSPTAERTVLLIGTLDTKGAEFDFLRDRLHQADVGVLLADVGTLEPASATADISREQVGAVVQVWPSRPPPSAADFPAGRPPARARPHPRA